MKYSILFYSLFLALTAQSQITYLKGGNFFCPGEEVEFWAYGDTITHWAYADEPDSIISTDWHFVDQPEFRRDYYLYSSVDTTFVEVNDGESRCFCKCYIPNMFTPDGDLFNETFEPVLNCNAVSSRLTIFSREQLVIYDEQGLYLKWSGRNSETGLALQVGTYSYIFSYLTEDGETITVEGFVMLSS